MYGCAVALRRHRDWCLKEVDLRPALPGSPCLPGDVGRVGQCTCPSARARVHAEHAFECPLPYSASSHPLPGTQPLPPFRRGDVTDPTCSGHSARVVVGRCRLTCRQSHCIAPEPAWRESRRGAHQGGTARGSPNRAAHARRPRLPPRCRCRRHCPLIMRRESSHATQACACHATQARRLHRHDVRA